MCSVRYGLSYAATNSSLSSGIGRHDGGTIPFLKKKQFDSISQPVSKAELETKTFYSAKFLKAGF